MDEAGSGSMEHEEEEEALARGEREYYPLLECFALGHCLPHTYHLVQRLVDKYSHRTTQELHEIVDCIGYFSRFIAL